MTKKAFFLCSSPRRNSNTSIIVNLVADKLRKKGVEIKIVDVANLKYKTNGCIDCGGCQVSEKFECVINDEASEILKEIPKYDFLILATPVYFFGANAQIKLILDRMQSFYKFKETGTVNCISHLKIGLISTAGGGINLGINLLDETMKTMCKYTGVDYCSLLVPQVKQYNNMSENIEILKKAEDFAGKLII